MSEIEPSAVPAPTQAPERVYRRLLSYLKPHRGVFILAILANVAYAAIETWFIQAIAPLLDEGLLAKNTEILAMAPYVFFGAVVARSIFGFISLYGIEWVGRKVVKKMRQELYEKYLRLPASYYDQKPGGFLLSKMTYNTERLAGAVTSGFTSLIRDGATVAIVLFYMFYLQWKMALIFFISGPLIGVVAQMATRRFKRTGKKIQEAMGGVAQTTDEAIGAYRVIRGYNGEEREAARFERINETNRKQFMKFILTKAVSVPLVQIIASIGVALVIAYATTLIQLGQLSPGEFVVMMGLMFYLLKPLKQLTTINSVIQEGVAAASDIFELIDAPSEKDEGKVQLTAPKGDIRFNRVSFRYETSEKSALNGIQLDIDAGQSVALVGRSGSGKSTIAALFLRLYQDYKGSITLDGREIQDYSLDSFRRQIADVSQSVILFNETIRYNIAYGRDDVDDIAIQAAAESAFAWDFIQNLPNGLDTVVGEDGAMLSGGQRQRIAIARAFLKDAPVLILDEATSALDTESERKIQDALNRLMKNKTTIIVAHRLSTIEQADTIFVMDQGRIVEQGKHQALLEKGGAYANLYQNQIDNPTA